MYFSLDLLLVLEGQSPGGYIRLKAYFKVKERNEELKRRQERSEEEIKIVDNREMGVGMNFMIGLGGD